VRANSDGLSGNSGVRRGAEGQRARVRDRVRARLALAWSVERLAFRACRSPLAPARSTLPKHGYEHEHEHVGRVAADVQCDQAAEFLDGP
jgi:hypothetical protein